MAHSRSPGKDTQSPKYLQGRVYWILYTEDLLFHAMYYLVLHAEAKVMVHMTCTHTNNNNSDTAIAATMILICPTLSQRERERRGCVTNVHGKRVLEVVDVSTS
jgi:hypothetical protein